jgi:hypothetical protein
MSGKQDKRSKLICEYHAMLEEGCVKKNCPFKHPERTEGLKEQLMFQRAALYGICVEGRRGICTASAFDCSQAHPITPHLQALWGKKERSGPQDQAKSEGSSENYYAPLLDLSDTVL